MKLKTIYNLLALAIAAAGMLVALSGCSREKRAGDEYIPESKYRMSVTVVTSSSATRAQHSDDATEQGVAAENFIDFAANDFRMVVFDAGGEYLLEIDGLGKWNRFPYSTDGDYVYYQMECELEFPESLTETDLNRIVDGGLQVMVLANWRNARGTGAYDNLFTLNNGARQNLAAIWTDATRYNFDYQPEAGNVTWRPSNAESDKKLIPMFGFAKPSKFVRREGTGALYSSVTIPMQRAVAKIEVIDNLAQQNLAIDEVTMTGFNTSGRFIPNVAANPNWNKLGEQVDVSSLPAGVSRLANLKFFHEPSTNKWIAYVPEMALEYTSNAQGGFLIPQNRTRLEVKVRGDYDFYKGDTYDLHFARYDGITFEPKLPDDSWNHILRNHIYRFSINKVGVSVNLHLHVIPWEADDEEVWEFTDNVSVSQTLRWLEDSYEKLDEDTGEVVLSFDRATVLEGTFKIMTPVNGKWYAKLTPIGDAKPGAITFVDASGNVMDPAAGDPKVCLEVSGLINGDEATIRIKPTEYGNDSESQFRLEFFVENLGVWLEVPMVENDNYKHYTIVRQSNIIVTNF